MVAAYGLERIRQELDRPKAYLLGVANGVVDLRTGELRPAARDDYVTCRTSLPFRPGWQAPGKRGFTLKNAPIRSSWLACHQRAPLQSRQLD
jgi:phage/plasmid-associated DNA primase